MSINIKFKLVIISCILIFIQCKRIEYEYYSDNIILSKTEVDIFGNKNGKSLTYYLSGKLMYSENYQKNKLHGIRNSYYDNGNLKSKFIYLNDKLVGEQIKFYTNGNISQYFYTNMNEENLFNIKYDEEGKIISIVGNPLIMVVFDGIRNNTTFKKGEILGYTLHVASPKGFSIKLLIAFVKNNKEKPVFEHVEVNDCKFHFNKKLTESGEFRVYHKLLFVNDNTNEESIYEDNFPVFVN